MRCWSHLWTMVESRLGRRHRWIRRLKRLGILKSMRRSRSIWRCNTSRRTTPTHYAHDYPAPVAPKVVLDFGSRPHCMSKPQPLNLIPGEKGCCGGQHEFWICHTFLSLSQIHVGAFPKHLHLLSLYAYLYNSSPPHPNPSLSHMHSLSDDVHFPFIFSFLLKKWNLLVSFPISTKPTSLSFSLFSPCFIFRSSQTVAFPLAPQKRLEI